MHMSRVKEILASDDDISVHYQGIPVWIATIDDTTGMAFVSLRGTHDAKRLFPIEGFEEN